VFVVEGPSLVAAAADHGWEIESVFTAAGHQPVRTFAAETYELGPGVIERVASTEAPQPLLAVVRRRTATLDALGGCTFVLVGDRIADPGNAGTMLRSAEAAGADAVVFTTGSVDVFNPKVVRSSAGALFSVPTLVVDATIDEVLAVPGVRSFGTSSHTGTVYSEVDFRAHVAIVVGNEAHGLDSDTHVDEWVTIPHAGRAESLNVAMAATVLVFEVARQRRAR
jgi:RNA methyltransferase, TrmH family